jgi:hypothetical protein
MSLKTCKKIFFLACLAFFLFYGYKFFVSLPLFQSRSLSFVDVPKNIVVRESDLFFTATTTQNTVGDWLSQNKISLEKYDEVIPARESRLFPGMQLEVRRAKKITLSVDGKTLEKYSLQNNVAAAIFENKILLGKLDKISPDLHSPLEKNAQIIITRINVEEKIITEDIDFSIVYENDAKLGWREEKIKVPGQKGTREVKYKITYKNGQEVSRVALEKNILQKPTTQVVIKGTYMQLGKAAKGQGTWYAWKGGLFAASTTIAKGTFVKVTNTANGKTVIVQINDYGPQGKGRIIDLDKVAFAKIASLGAGVIGVKVEEILN